MAESQQPSGMQPLWSKNVMSKPELGHKIKEAFIGKELNLGDKSIFHRLTLVAFFAWVGLGADGLSSSCYGPAEAFIILGEHRILAILVGLMTAVTICVIATSYSQIIELFPDGGGGYYVASRLLSPKLGMFSGCALIIDYVLTITLSIASGADAVLSLLPQSMHDMKMPVALMAILLLTVINLRGAKESIKILLPIFMVFVIVHAFAIIYALVIHAVDAPAVMVKLTSEVEQTHTELGMIGLFALLLKAYSMGAGTYTGLEAVSNGMPMLREPRVQTGKRTMFYMALSLSLAVVGLMLAYVLFSVRPEAGRTINASLFSAMTAAWPGGMSRVFIIITLTSEALILFVAAQTGFLDGPRVMSNMALDRWLPARFTMLSDRLVTQNGVLCFSLAAILLMVISRGDVSHLVVLYSINVFITFVLSQAGMVRHWWQGKLKNPVWKRKLAVNGIGLLLTSFILVSIVVVKFTEGAWMTLVVTGAVVLFALYVRRHYDDAGQKIKKLQPLVNRTEQFGLPVKVEDESELTRFSPTAVLLVGGYNGLGMQSLLSLISYHAQNFRRIIFMQIGVVDVSVFRHPDNLEAIKQRLQDDTEKYVKLAERSGFTAEALWAVGTNVVEEVMRLAPALTDKYPRSVFFGGQLMFDKDTFMDRLLHNYQGFSLQRELFRSGVPFEMLPVPLDDGGNSRLNQRTQGDAAM